MEAPKNHRMSRAAYVRASLEWDTKHEWVNGEAWAMSGSSIRHNLVSANVLVGLHAALRAGPCRVTTSDQRVLVEATEACFYPDATVVCGDPIASDDDPHALVNPAVVVEVLSPSTRATDLDAKVRHYLQVPTLHHVLLVEPDSRYVIQRRQVSGISTSG